jgi:hypothetical protein
MYDFSKIGSMELQEIILDKMVEVGELECKKQCTEGLTGSDLHWATLINKSLDVEIRLIKKFILTVKETIRQRVVIK